MQDQFLKALRDHRCKCNGFTIVQMHWVFFGAVVAGVDDLRYNGTVTSGRKMLKVFVKKLVSTCLEYFTWNSVGSSCLPRID